MTLYHGTSNEYIKVLTSSHIDIHYGGGEFGQGFYTGNKVYLVSAWAWHKSKQNMAVISYKIDDSTILDIKVKQLNTNQAVSKRAEIRKCKMNRKLVFKDYDLVIGPVVGRPFANYLQFVFVGTGGQNFINAQKAKQLWNE